MRQYAYLDTNTRLVTNELSALFPGWRAKDEVLCVYSPHDDDAIIGAGYAMRAALDDGAQVHVFIVCNGNAGYSTPEERETIVQTRKEETIACYETFGIPRENIVFFDYPDFSAIQYIGWQIAPDREGHFRRAITQLRTRAITRMLVPNQYHEHIDHTAAGMMAAYDAPQAGDAFAVDWAKPHGVLSVAEYAVWADMSPEDALIAGRDTRLRANTVLIASESVEQAVDEGIARYVSQQAIIADLVAQRKERRLPDGRYIEVYRRFDPRPKLDFSPYRDMIANVMPIVE